LPFSANGIALSEPPILLGQKLFLFPLRILLFNSSEHLPVWKVTAQIAKVIGKKEQQVPEILH